ncbi:MAG: hypothetical protein DRP00_04950 [Candidatus Aenigmatarchaeota archaeon]|nr:MAG: hypothetical protein DRP00_04950 [Candidatus Aenigmarchaeota archaeon]
MVEKMPISYLAILDRLLVKKRSVIRESSRYFKVYLPSEYNDIWKRLHDERRKVDVIVLLPETIENVDKILALNRYIIKENDRYRLYLPKKYNDIWEELYRKKEKIDLLIVFK